MSDLTPVPLKVGDLAYLVTCFNGNIPCKVTKLEQGKGTGVWFAGITLTATRGAYEKGETLYEPARNVAPRKCQHVKNYKYFIRDSWHVVDSKGVRHEVFTA